MSTFDSTKRPLKDVLADIVKGNIQLPDFQRGWIWDDEHVRSLLISVARSFPVGAVMLLQTGGAARFQVRPVENVPYAGAPPVNPEYLILDGQQRLTTLTQVLSLQGPVKTTDEKGKPIERFYYFNIPTALAAPALNEALIAVDADRKQRTNFGRDVKLDLSTRERECQQLYFPCREIMVSDDWETTMFALAGNLFGQYMTFRKEVLEPI